jgi:hypothetical protein
MSSERQPGGAGIVQSVPETELPATDIIPNQQTDPLPPALVEASPGLFNKLRNKVTTLIAVGTAALALATGPNLEEQPAYAVNSKQAVIGMPFTGKWAFTNKVTPPYTDSNSSHPSVHNPYSFQWATDLYGAADTEVRVYGSSPQGPVTFKRVSTLDTCSSYGANIAGSGVTFDVLVDGSRVGQVKYDHLDLVDVGNEPIASGAKVGEITSESLHPSCYQVPHAHIQFKNTEGDQSCYMDHGDTGQTLNAGVALGVLGSSNTNAQEACAETPSGGGTTPPPADKIDELGFVRTNHASGRSELVAWHGAPNYTTVRASSLTGYPAVSDPEHVTPLAIDTDGDGIDELGFVRTNHASGRTELSLWHGAPHYTTHLITTLTGYPAISDPENVVPLAIDLNGDGRDELAFFRMKNHGSGQVEMVAFHGSPHYTTLYWYNLVNYPAVSDPQNVTPLALDLGGDKTDELAFVRTNHPAGKAEFVAFDGAPTYHIMHPPVLTPYPAVSDPEHVTPIAINVNNNDIDELGFVRTNHPSGQTEIALYHGAPTFHALYQVSLTGYPAIADPANVTPLAMRLPH